jgi:hypothetical protein
MTDKELNIRLREMARKAGLCDKWYEEWGDDDTIDMCLDRYVKGFDFSVKNDYPPLDFIRDNFRKEDLHRHNIYLDEEVEIKGAKSGYYVFLGNCTGTIEAHGFNVVSCYLRHGSKIDVTSLGSARVFVTYYDRSGGLAYKDEWGRIKQYDRRKKEG